MATAARRCRFHGRCPSILIGQRRAKQLSYEVGSRITAQEAESWGFVNFTVPQEDLVERTQSYARRLAKMPRTGLEVRKASITRASMGLSFREALLAGVEWDVIAHADPDITAMRQFVKESGVKSAIEAFEQADAGSPIPPRADHEGTS